MTSNSKSPLVTVLIPTYDRRERVVACLHSVFQQTYENMEIVVIDDGSSDGTADAIELNFGNRVSYFWQENQGQSAALKFGLSKAKGDLVAFLDSDDIWKPNKLNRQVEYLDSNPEIVAVYTDAEEYVTFGTDHKSYASLHPLIRQPDDLMNSMVNLNIPLRSTVVCRRGFLQEHQINPDPEAQGKDDVQVFMEIIGHGGKFGFVNEVTTFRMMHDSNMSGDHYKKFFRRIATFKNMLARCGDLPSEWQNQVKKALSNSYFRVGEHHWGRMEFGEARKYFKKAIKIRKTNFAAMQGIAYTLIPGPLVSVLRRVKNRLVQ